MVEEPKKKSKPQVWNDKKDPLKEDEDLEYDGSAYQMLHRSQVEWPCLSIDWLLRERASFDGVSNPKAWFPNLVNGQLDQAQTVIDKNKIARHKNDKFPMTVYMVAGSQADKKSDNKIYVMKWADMHKTVNEDENNSDSDDESARREPTI